LNEYEYIWYKKLGPGYRSYNAWFNDDSLQR
jgi:hypothetical protein